RRRDLVLLAQPADPRPPRPAADAAADLARPTLGSAGAAAGAAARPGRRPRAHRLPDPPELLACKARVARRDRAACLPGGRAVRLVPGLPARRADQPLDRLGDRPPAARRLLGRGA